MATSQIDLRNTRITFTILFSPDDKSIYVSHDAIPKIGETINLHNYEGINDNGLIKRTYRVTGITHNMTDFYTSTIVVEVE